MAGGHNKVENSNLTIERERSEKHLEKGNRETKMNLKEKENKYTQDILTFLWEEGFATSEQIRRHIFSHLSSKTSFHRRKLLKMEKQGLIGKKNVFFESSVVYYLTETGWGKMENPVAGDISPLQHRKITVARGPHRLKCIEARIELEKLLPIEKYWSERTLTLSNLTLLRKPDFIFISNGKIIAVEVELTYRGGKRYREIFGAWCYSLKKEIVDRVLFLTETEAMAENLKRRLNGIYREQKETSKFLTIEVPTAIEGEQRQEQVWIEDNDLKNFIFCKIGGIKNVEQRI